MRFNLSEGMDGGTQEVEAVFSPSCGRGGDGVVEARYQW